jgi:hypothetical protein
MENEKVYVVYDESNIIYGVFSTKEAMIEYIGDYDLFWEECILDEHVGNNPNL